MFWSKKKEEINEVENINEVDDIIDRVISLHKKNPQQWNSDDANWLDYRDYKIQIMILSPHFNEIGCCSLFFDGESIKMSCRQKKKLFSYFMDFITWDDRKRLINKAKDVLASLEK
jgi:hypothetical protein